MKRLSPIFSQSSANASAPVTGVIANMQIVTDVPQADLNQDFVCDLSALRKRLVVGRGAREWIAQHTGSCQSEMFQLQTLAGGGYIVRIHRDQYLVADVYGANTFDELFTLPTGRHGEVLILDYECAEIVLAGPNVDTVMSELCPLPPSEMPMNYWLATRMAHADVVITGFESPSRHYRIIVTPADARFVYGTYLDAVTEQGGSAIGYENYWQAFMGLSHEELPNEDDSGE